MQAKRRKTGRKAFLAAAMIGACRLAGAQEPAAPSPAEPPAAAESPAAPAPQPAPVPNPETKPAPESGKTDSKKKNASKKRDGKQKSQNDPAADEPEGQYRPERSMSAAEKLLGKWGKDLTITGGALMRLQQNSVSGTRESARLFNDQNVNNLDFRNAGPFQQNMDLSVQGRIFNLFNVNARISNSRFVNEFNQFGFEYQNRDKTTKIDLGDVDATLPGNELVTFSRSLQGVSFERDFGKGRVKTKTFASYTRAVTRRGTFQGNGTSGPYFLSATWLLEGSERVRLNGQELKAGEHYRIDYQLGQISFLGGRIIQPQDTVEFTYEARNFNTTPGLLTGTRWNVADGRGATYGFTYVRQQATGQRTSNGNIIERFPVMPDPAYRYFLSSPIDPAVRVQILWYNRELREGEEYVLNRELRYFMLVTTALPPDSAANYNGNPSLQVIYRPLRQASLTGDRNVVGFDTSMKVARNADVVLHYGRSEGIDPSQNGDAITLRTTVRSPGEGNRHRWQMDIGYKSIADTFSTVDSVDAAFLQAQRGLSLNLSYAPDPRFRFTSAVNQSQVANRVISAAPTMGRKLDWMSNQDIGFTADMNVPKMPTLQFSHRQTTQGNGEGGGRNAFSSTRLLANWRASATLQLSGEVAHTASEGRSVFGAAHNNNVSGTGGLATGTIIDQLLNNVNNNSVNNSSSNLSRISVTYTPASWVNIGANLGLSRSASGTQTGDRSTSSGNTARTSGLSVSLTPVANLTMSASLDDSSNGQSTSGYYDPSSGGSSIIPTGQEGQRVRSTTFSAQYMPTSRLTLAGNYSRSLSLIPGFDNTSTATSDFMVNVAATSWLQLGVAVMEQGVTYVGGQGDSHNRSLSFTTTYGPVGRFSVNSVFTRMQFNSATFTNRVGSSLTRQFGLPGVLNGSNLGGTGFLQQGRNLTWVVQPDYALNSRYSLVGSWQWLDQSAPVVGGAGGSENRAGTNFGQGTGSLGLDVRITEIMRFHMFFNYISLRDRTDPRYSYRARTFTADISARF